MSEKVRGRSRVFARKDVWWIAYYHRGKEIRESTTIRLDPKKRDQGKGKAWQMLDRRKGEIAARTFVGPSEERVTFEELVKLYRHDYEVRGLRSRETVEARVKHLAAFFGLSRALDITATRVRDYQQHRLTEQAEAATINSETAALHRMLRLAMKQGRLTMAPVFPDRLEENPPRQGFFEQPEYEAIRQYLPGDYQDVLDFGYYTGWRRREVTGLTWDEVDLAGSVIRLDPARAKSKKARLLPLSLPLRDVIERRVVARQTDSPLVFHKQGLPVGDWRKTWNGACVKAGISRTFHDLRRTAARN